MKKRLKVGLAAAGLAALVIWWAQTPVPEAVRPANIAARSFSLGWITDKPTGGCALAAASWRDWRFSCDRQRKYSTHLADFKQVSAETVYRIVMIDGPRLRWRNLPYFKTLAIADQQPKLPRPAYGAIRDNSGAPLKKTLVYLSAFDDLDQPLAALTNDDGNYAFDLSNFQSASGYYLLEVVSGQDYRRVEVDSRTVSPLPTLIVASYAQAGPMTIAAEGPTAELFNQLTKTYFDAAVWNIGSTKFAVSGVVFMKFDDRLGTTFVFSRLENFPSLPDRTVQLWLVKNISEYRQAGIVEGADSESKVGYSVFAADGDLTDYDKLLVSYDSSTSVDHPESVVASLTVKEKK